MKVVTAAQMAAIEQAAGRAGIAADTLMENAGRAVAQAARDELGGVVAGVPIAVLVGPGNNGADGLVAARHLRRWGAETVCFLFTRRPEFDPKLELARQYDVQIATGLDDLERRLRQSRLIIDAVLGTGRSRPLDGPVRDAMLMLQRTRERPHPPPLLALDLPTGLNADTGEVDPACPIFDVTLALGYPKAGLLRFPGAERAGRLRILDIGIPINLPDAPAVDLEMLTPQWAAAQLPPRPPDSHKGTYGHALIIAGSRHYPGAAWLASQASVRTGAGLTTLASPQSVYPIAAAKGAEAIHLPLPEDQSGRIAPSAAEVIRRSERRFTAALIGCGIGRSPATAAFIRQLLFTDAPDTLPKIPILIDADGLNNLSAIENWPARIRRPMLLTPHPGEMSTLTGRPVAEIQSDPIAAAQEWANRWGVTLILKGAHTVIAAPGQPTRIAPFPNPGLATGGTGDVLSGVITGLLAQGMPPPTAAGGGVYLHAAAGRSITARIGQTGLAASDLLEALPPTIAALRHDKL